MTLEGTAGTAGSEGQAGTAPQGAGGEGALQTTGGQPAGTTSGTSATQTTGQGAEADVIFDPATFNELTKDLPEGVKLQASALLKQLQGSYTKKTQSIAQMRKAAEAYQAFEADPHNTIKAVAKQLGYDITPVGGNKQPGNGNGDGWSPEKGDPKDWSEVVQYVMQQLTGSLGEKLKPVLGEFQNIKKASIESQLSEIDPSWKTYEDAMMQNLSKHPTLSSDPSMLYRLSVPAEVLESRATQKALAKLEAKLNGGKTAGASTTTRRPESGLPDKPVSFAEAVAAAEAKLASQGIRKGA